jgi:RNA polymerase sigma factor (sigma-70 family)
MDMLTQTQSIIQPIVYVVDDEESIRRAIARLVGRAGYQVLLFQSAEEFLVQKPSDAPSCLILDVNMPGLTGMDLQEALVVSGHNLPIIFVSGYANVPMSVKAMKTGAFDFLTKPFTAEELLEAISKAIETDIRQKKEKEEIENIQSRIETLTPREAEVFSLVVTGMLNKQIAAELGISEKTIKVHRARVMEKMRAGSLAELVKLAEHAGKVIKSRPLSD